MKIFEGSDVLLWEEDKGWRQVAQPREEMLGNLSGHFLGSVSLSHCLTSLARAFSARVQHLLLVVKLLLGEDNWGGVWWWRLKLIPIDKQLKWILWFITSRYICIYIYIFIYLYVLYIFLKENLNAGILLILCCGISILYSETRTIYMEATLR